MIGLTTRHAVCRQAIVNSFITVNKFSELLRKPPTLEQRNSFGTVSRIKALNALVGRLSRNVGRENGLERVLNGDLKRLFHLTF